MIYLIGLIVCVFSRYCLFFSYSIADYQKELLEKKGIFKHLAKNNKNFAEK